MTITEQQLEENEEHPFEPFVPKDATKLIIGSIPPQRFWKHKNDSNSLLPDDVNFYYGSCDNSFWSLVGKVYDITFENTNTQSAIEQRKKFLTEKRIGITDIVGKCSRIKGSAEDKKLLNIKHKDLAQLLKDNPQITTLIYTSDFIKQQVNKLFNNTYHTIVDKTNRQYKIKINNKVYDVKILYSPSPNGLRNMGKNGSERRLRQYQEVLGD